ncbi:MAG: hypothetical protein PHU49_02680 [Syntrophorhabdaceae bacterium]|nr:hypothetical protein [Syntrophorhabdaceae bacterium]MDD5242901.1 hypothetical protein [Syntrophorhabdaceae bacterium]
METYRIDIHLHGGVLTPFQADTVFGHLCWTVAQNEGDGALEEFLRPFLDGNPPFVISDGFPAGFLPKPLGANFLEDDPERLKEIKKIVHVGPEDFGRIAAGGKTDLQARDVPGTVEISIHNRIDRQTGKTPSEGGLYGLVETHTPYVTVYIKTVSEAWKDRVADLFRKLSLSGYGRRKSAGKGHFTAGNPERFNFPEVKDANGFVTLSGFCPAENDPVEGLYQISVKYGKLGEEFTVPGNPFKKPLLVIATGSVFRTAGAPAEFYGRMITGIAPAKPEAVQYTYAFAVPVKMPRVTV